MHDNFIENLPQINLIQPKINQHRSLDPSWEGLGESLGRPRVRFQQVTAKHVRWTPQITHLEAELVRPNMDPRQLKSRSGSLWGRSYLVPAWLQQRGQKPPKIEPSWLNNRLKIATTHGSILINLASKLEGRDSQKL